jgi:hypothetical protein
LKLATTNIPTKKPVFKRENKQMVCSKQLLTVRILTSVLASGGFKDKYPKGKIDLNIDTTGPRKLNLHAGPLKLEEM